MKKPAIVAACAFALGLSFCYGVLAHRYNLVPVSWARIGLYRLTDDSQPRPPGYWGVARDGGQATAADLTAEEREQLLALPYAQGSQPEPDHHGVVRHDRDRAFQGLNLYTSGHGYEAILMDMKGRVLHRWAVPFELVFPDIEASTRPAYWRRARLLPDGDLLAIFGYTGLVRIDRDSTLRWVHREKNHHDIDVDDQGRIYVLTQENRRNPRSEKGQIIGDDRITILSPDGEVIRHLSLYDCLDRSRYASVLERMGDDPDVFHANAVKFLDGSATAHSEIFRRGNLLVSIRDLDTVAVIDPEPGEVVWSLSGLWHRQHEPLLLSSGRLLVFDNQPLRERSRVVEIDPFTQELFWEYSGSADEPFHSKIGGSNQRLPNGNTLITETDYGRAIEVTPDGRIVWEFVNPERAGDRDELIAVLWDVVRLDAGSAGFLERQAASSSAP